MTPHDGAGNASNPNLYPADSFVSVLLQGDGFGEVLRRENSNFVAFFRSFRRSAANARLHA